jgi:putative pantetheine hydrolase
LTDVPGLRVGHAGVRTCTETRAGALTGTTVVLCPPGGAVAGVDVRGAAPGTRETDLLDPHRLVERVHALVLTGGSAYGLAAVDGVMSRLEAAGIGHPVGAEPHQVVPIVPAAVCFDLGRGGDFGARPTAATGAEAYDVAASASGVGAVAQGVVGAGTGAAVGGLKGGIGTASVVLPAVLPAESDGAAGGGAGAPSGEIGSGAGEAGGAVGSGAGGVGSGAGEVGGAVGSGAGGAGEVTVAALVVLNAAGSAIDPGTGELYGARFGLPGEFANLGRPDPAQLAASLASGVLRAGPVAALRATTLAIIATDATLTPAQTTLLAQMGADGLARAVRPVHTMVDGDTTFALATGGGPVPSFESMHGILAAAADCVSRAIVHAALAAETVRTPAGEWPGYTDALPTALR